MNYYELPEWAGWLASIREQPDDDHRRLFCADWLDELETDEARQRAELIRVQCMMSLAGECVCGRTHKVPTCRPCYLRNREFNLLADHGRRFAGWDAFRVLPAPISSPLPAGKDEVEFDRGFVTRVSATLAVLHGGVCRGGCEGGGRWAEWGTSRPCPHCRGTGRTPGVLGELLRREPITAVGIEVTQVSPVGVVPNEYMRSGTGPERNWAWGFSESTPHGEYMIPREVWDLMPPTKLAEPRGRFKVFPTQDAARLALGEALIRLHGPKSEVTT